MVSGLVIYLVGDVKVIEGGEDIVFDGLSHYRVPYRGWCRLRVPQSWVSMRYVPLPFLKGLIIKSALEPSFRRVDLCCEARLGLVVCQSG